MESIAIIGGGITGLTAAFRLQQAGLSPILYEAGSRVGGVIQSVRENGYLAEAGPNTILETSPLIGELVRDLGLTSRRLYSEPRAENRYVVRNRQPVRLPTSKLGFLRTPLFSLSAKLRLLAEPFISRAPESVEENLSEFVVRRLGREFLDYAINPFVAGVYAGDPARLSVQHAFPKLHALERRYGSLIVGQFLGARERKKRAEVSKQSAKKLSFDEGLQVLIDTLGQRLGPAVRLRSQIKRLRQTQRGWLVEVEGAGREADEECEAVLFAAPPFNFPKVELLAGAEINGTALAEIRYPPVASVVLGFRREQVSDPLHGFGVLIPEVERFRILGTIYSSSLFPKRAPAGHVTLTSYVGGTRCPDLALAGPDKILGVTLEDLGVLLGVTGQPTFVHTTVFPRAIPQYEVGYGRFLEEMNEIEKRAPGLFLAGPFRNGISLGDSIVAGHNVAERIRSHLPIQRG